MGDLLTRQFHHRSAPTSPPSGAREATGWEFRALRDANDRIVIPDIGDIGAFAACHKDTPLAPKTS